MNGIETILDARTEELRAIDDMIFGDVIGVAQAADQLREALDVIGTALDERKFEAAAALGYGDIASAFIFLQRILGGLQMAEHRKQVLISNVAEEARCTYEEAEPHVVGRLQCARPKAGQAAWHRVIVGFMPAFARSAAINVPEPDRFCSGIVTRPSP